MTQPSAEWSGDRVARMSGDLCAEPVEHFFTRAPARSWSIFTTLETFVFDVRNARWRERNPRPGERPTGVGEAVVDPPGAVRTRDNAALEQDPPVPPARD